MAKPSQAGLAVAYIFKQKSTPRVEWLPYRRTLPNLKHVTIDYFHEDDFDACRNLLNSEIEVGTSYPFEDVMNDDEFRAYFLAGDAFVAKDDSGRVAGVFYVKPNFPGICDHICNGGFITAPDARRCGVGRMMGEIFPYVARDLGYEASMFNLVFVKNEASVALWRSLGFKELGRIPDAGRLKGLGRSDAIQFFRRFSDLPNTRP